MIETEQKTEYLAYSAFQNSKVPVPVLLDMSEDKNILGAPFMLMKELEGEAASPFTPDVYSPNEKELGNLKEKLSIKTRQYAKRQSTWSRGHMMNWNKVEPKDLNKFLKKIK